MLRVAWACAIAFLMCRAVPGGADSPEDALVQEINERLNTQHPMTAADAIWRDPKKWHSLLHGVAHGHERLMDAAARLSAGTDAGISEQIDLAFGDALAEHPGAVLRLAPDLGSSCSNIDEPFTKSLRRALAEVDRRIAAVSKVVAPNLQGERSRCLAALNELKRVLPDGY
jgi:hypothetical protein